MQKFAVDSIFQPVSAIALLAGCQVHHYTNYRNVICRRELNWSHGRRKEGGGRKRWERRRESV